MKISSKLKKELTGLQKALTEWTKFVESKESSLDIAALSNKIELMQSLSSEVELVLNSSVKSFQIFVKSINGKTYTLDISSDSLVEEIKAKIEAKIKIPVNEQRLIYEGKQLVDGKPAQDYNLEKSSTLHLTLSLDGGMDIYTLSDIINIPVVLITALVRYCGGVYEAYKFILNRNNNEENIEAVIQTVLEENKIELEEGSEIVEIEREEKNEIIEVEREEKNEIIEVEREEKNEIVEIEREEKNEIVEIEREEKNEIIEVEREEKNEIVEVEREEKIEIIEIDEEVVEELKALKAIWNEILSIDEDCRSLQAEDDDNNNNNNSNSKLDKNLGKEVEAAILNGTETEIEVLKEIVLFCERERKRLFELRFSLQDPTTNIQQVESYGWGDIGFQAISENGTLEIFCDLPETQEEEHFKIDLSLLNERETTEVLVYVKKLEENRRTRSNTRKGSKKRTSLKVQVKDLLIQLQKTYKTSIVRSKRIEVQTEANRIQVIVARELGQLKGYLINQGVNPALAKEICAAAGGRNSSIEGSYVEEEIWVLKRAWKKAGYKFNFTYLTNIHSPGDEVLIDKSRGESHQKGSIGKTIYEPTVNMILSVNRIRVNIHIIPRGNKILKV